MEKLIVVLVIILALFIMVKRVRNLAKEPACDTCRGQCQECKVKKLEDLND